MATESSSGSSNISNDFLSYGDAITISDEKGGLLICSDAIKPRAYVVGSTESNLRSKFSTQSFVFQIQPPQNRSAYREYRKVIETEDDYFDNNFKKRQIKEIVQHEPELELENKEGKDGQGGGSTRNRANSINLVKESNVGMLAKAVEVEDDQNLLEFRRVDKKVILYGQIVHLYNLNYEKYLQVNSRSMCEYESNSLTVDLGSNLDKSTKFKILPRYKVRVEGERVRMNDRIMFQNLKTGGYITGSGFKFKHEVSQTLTSEVCNSTKMYSWKCTKYHHFPIDETQRIYAGQLIRLFHKEKEAYLQTEFSLDQPYIQNYKVNVLNPSESTEPSTFWRIEKESLLHGGTVRWSDKVRLRHPITGLYLAVVPPTSPNRNNFSSSTGLTIDVVTHATGEFKMVEGSNLDSFLDQSLFKLSPVASNHSYLYGGAFIHLQHVATKLWLHIGSPINHTTDSLLLKEITDHVDLNVDLNQQFRLVTSIDEQSENSFSVTVVEKELVTKTNYIEQIQPTINRFFINPRPTKNLSLNYPNITGLPLIEGLEDDLEVFDEVKFPISDKEFVMLKRILVSLIYFCTESSELDPLARVGLPLKDNQDILRETGLLMKLTLLLKTPFDLELRQKVAKQLALGQNSSNLPNGFSPQPNEKATSLSDLKSQSESNLVELLTLTYKLVEQSLAGPNVDNQLYLAPQIRTYWQHVGLELRAPHAIVNLLISNSQTIDNVTDQDILKIIGMLPGRKGKYYAFLDILATLCGDDQQPNRKNQTFIIDYMLRKSQEKDYIYHTMINPKTNQNDVKILTEDGFKKLRLDKFLSSSKSIDALLDEVKGNSSTSASFDSSGRISPQLSAADSSSDFLSLNGKVDQQGVTRLANRNRFFESTLKLYRAVCCGKNLEAVRTITTELNFLTFENCITALANRSLPFEIRSQYCYLLISLYIAVPPLNPVIIDNSYYIEDMKNNSNNIHCERLVASSIEGGSPSEPDPANQDCFGLNESKSTLTSEPLDISDLNIQGLKKSQLPAVIQFDKINQFLNNFITRQSNNKNKLPNPKAQCLLAAVLKLVSTLLNYGFFTKYKHISTLLTNLVDILDSRKETNDAKYNFKEGTKFVIEAKIEICAILEKIFEFRSQVRARKLLFNWRKLEDAGKEINDDQHQPYSLKMADDGVKMQKMIDTIVKEASYLSNPDKLMSILLDLLKYQNSNLRSSALKLIYKFHCGYTDMYSFATKVFILTQPEHIRVHEWIRPRFAELKSLIAHHRYQNAPHLEARIVTLLDEFYLVCSELGMIDYNGNLLKRTASRKHRVDVNPIHQILFVNLEVHTTVLRYLQRYLHFSQNLGYNSNFKHNVSIILSCSRFLEIVCKRDTELQNTILLKNLDLLIETIQYDSDIVADFCDLFSKNQFVCLSITETHVTKILNLCDGSDPSPLHLLKAIVKVNGRVVKRNQNMVTKLIVENRNFVIPTKLLKSLHRTKNTKQNPLQENELNYLIELVNLLALTSFGDNGFTKSLCQTIFLPITLLTQVISRTNSFTVKQAFLDLFVATYVANPEQPMQDIATHPLIWDFLNQINESIIDLQTDLTDKSEEELSFIFDSMIPFLGHFYELHYDSQTHLDTNLEYTILFSQKLLSLLHKIPFLQINNQKYAVNLLQVIEKLAFRGGFKHSLTRNDLSQIRQRLEESKETSSTPHSPNQFSPKMSPSSSSAYLDDTNSRFREFFQHLLENSSISKQKSLEFDKLSDHFSIDLQHQSVPPVAYLIQHLTDTSGLPTDEAKEFIDTWSLKIITNLLQPTVDLLEETTHVDNPDQFKLLIEKRNFIQNELDSYGCAFMAERLLSSENTAISESTLDLLIVLLSGGNKQVQNTLEQYFLSTRKERFFYFSHSEIRQTIATIDEVKQLMAVNLKSQHRRSLSGTNVIQANTLKTSMMKQSQLRQKTTLRANSLKLEEAINKAKYEESSNNSDFNMELQFSQHNKQLMHRMQQLMRLIQLFVEGHNYSLQNYLRFQPDNVKSFDLIKDTVDFFQSIVSISKSIDLDLVIQTLDTLTELSQGCVQNQIHIFNCKVVPTINIILRDSFSTHSNKDHAKITIVKGKAIQCLLSLLEDFNEETRPVFEEMAFLVDFKIILQNLNQLYVTHKQQLRSRQKTSVRNLTDSHSESYLAATDTGFLYTMLILTLFPHLTDQEQESASQSPAYDFFRKNTGHIEIIKEIAPGDRRLLPVLFPIPEICKYLADDVKHDFLWTVKRDSPTSKIQDLVFKAEDVIFMVKNRATIARNTTYLTLTENREVWWKGAYFITVLLQLLMLACVESPAPPTAEVAANIVNNITHTLHVPSCWYFGSLRILLGTLHLTLWALTFAEFACIHLPNIVNRNRLLRSQQSLSRTYLTKLLTYFDLEAVENMLDYAFEPKFLYHLGLTLFSILGLFFPFVYAIHLLDFVYRDEILQGVIASVTVNLNSLSRTAMLGVVIIYIYSVVSFTRFQHAFDANEGLFCDTLVSCFITVLSHGIRAGGGLGELLSAPTRDDGLYFQRVLLDMSFFLLVIIFLLNVIFGIIFDTFGRLRDERSDILQDMHNVCFICNIEASEFQRDAKGFDDHIKNDHNMWHYLFFLIHLNIKEVTEFNAHESYVADQLQSKDLSFFPINRALVLKDRDSDTKESEEKLQILEDALKVNKDKLDKLANVIEELSNHVSSNSLNSPNPLGRRISISSPS